MSQSSCVTYIECIDCQMYRVTDERESAREFERVHRETTGHDKYYRGPMPPPPPEDQR